MDWQNSEDTVPSSFITDEQVRSIAAFLAGDIAAALTVELVLPATGVCSTDGRGSSCCS